MHMYQPPQPPDIFYRFLFGHAHTQDIENFVYHADALATYVGAVWEDELLTFDFRNPNAEHYLRNLLVKIIRDIPPTQNTEELIQRSEITRSIQKFQQDPIPLDSRAQAVWDSAYYLLRQPWDDLDFAVFGRIIALFEMWQDVETDSPETIYREIIEDIWNKYGDEIQRACQHILQRYDPYYENK